MKTTILSQDGNIQLVLTPETDFEKEVVNKYGKDFSKVNTYKGSFRDCQGGWTREYQYDESLILRIDENK